MNPRPVVVERSLLLAAARETDYPRTMIGLHRVEGEAGWRDAVARALPIECATLLLGLEGALLAATDGGRARLAAAEAARPHDDEADDEPVLFGDEELLPVVRAAVALLPANVRDPIVREVAFVGVGVSSVAWTSTAGFVDAAGRWKSRVVVLGPRADVFICLHELGHVWVSGKPDSHAPAISAAGKAGLVALAAAQGWGDRVDSVRERGEVLANALALVWLLQSSAGRPA